MLSSRSPGTFNLVPGTDHKVALLFTFWQGRKISIQKYILDSQKVCVVASLLFVLSQILQKVAMCFRFCLGR